MTDFVTTVRVSRAPQSGASAAGSPALLYGAVGVAAAIAAGVAIASDNLAQRLTLAGVALVLALFLGYLHALMHATARGRVRVRTEGPLTFVPPASLDRWPLIIGVVALVPALVALIVDASQFTGQGAIWLVIITVAAVAWLGQQAFARRTPLGLQMADAGVRGVRGATSVELTWDQIGRASARPSGRDGALVIEAAGGPVSINASRLGSDPAVVAAVVEHFRTHPEDRHLLATPREALRAVETSHAD